jgi:Holliday junction resolvase
MSGKAPKRKGDGYERELAKYFNEKIFNGEDIVQRAPLSGGGAVKSSGGSDLKNTPYIYVEAKRTEKFQIHQSMKQVEENIKISNSKDIPLVITRRNRTETGDSLCVIKLDDFLNMYQLLIDNEKS